MLTKDKKNELIKDYQLKEGDTGSTEVQVAILSHRINELTNHLKSNKKDHSSRRAMYKLIGRRRGLLNYLQRKDLERYRDLIKRLNIRR